MLDGDTLVQDAQPTGYKLCVCEDTSAWDRVFAVKWSPCVSSSSPSSSAYPSSIFLCARDGKLRRYNFRTGESSTYQVMFRSFTMPMHQGALETAPAKPVLQHWDKMECIPAPAGDQDVSELVFLLGVSRCIYISALPGSSSALAMGTLSDSLDYVHGTSVVEMFSHEHRVTSLSVSNDGALLASGDEQGSLCVQLLRNFGIVHSSAWLTAPVPSSKLRCLQRVHNGPIFAICWLERNIVEETPVYTLATSSHDTVVRIFAVHTVVGSMRVEPAKVLHTATCAVFCLGASIFNTTENHFYDAQHLRLSDSDVTNVLARCEHHAVHVSDDLTDASSVRTPRTKLQQIVAAGTSHGTLYVWDYETLELLCLIHHSDAPLLHVTLAHCTEHTAHDGTGYIVVGDATGIVRVYTTLPEQRVQDDCERVTSQHAPRSFLLAGEIEFNAPIVACAFNSNADQLPPALTSLPSTYEHARLCVCTAIGSLRCWRTDQLPIAVSHRKDRGISDVLDTTLDTVRDNLSDRGTTSPVVGFPGSDTIVRSLEKPTVCAAAASMPSERSNETAERTPSPRVRIASVPAQLPQPASNQQFTFQRSSFDSFDDDAEHHRPVVPVPEPFVNPRKESQDSGANSIHMSASGSRAMIAPRIVQHSGIINRITRALSEQDAGQLFSGTPATAQYEDVDASPNTAEGPVLLKRADLACGQDVYSTASEIAYPRPHTSLHLKQKHSAALAAMRPRMEVACASDRKEASRVLSVQRHETVFHNLVSIEPDDSSFLSEARKPRVRKQVNANWAKKKAELKPTEAVLEQLKLKPPEPRMVFMKLNAHDLHKGSRRYESAQEFEESFTHPKVHVDLDEIAGTGPSLGKWLDQSERLAETSSLRLLRMI